MLGILVPLSLWALGPGVATADTLSLKDALELALRQHPSARQADAQRDAARARIGRAYAAYLPAIDVSLGARDDGYNASPVTNPPTTSGTTAWFNAFTYAGSIGIQQRIYDFGRTAGAVANARANHEQARLDIETAQRIVELGVVQAYMDVLRNREVARINSETAEIVAGQLRHAEALFKISMRSEIDVLSAQAQMAQVRLSRLQIDQRIEAARLALRNAVGANEGEYDAIDVELTAIDIEDRPREELINAALDRRSEILAARAQITASEATLRAIRGDYFPVISSEGGVTANGSDSAWVPRYDAFVSLGVTLPVFSGWDTRRGVQEALASIRAAREALEVGRQRIALSVGRAVLAVKLAHDTLALATEARKGAERQLALAKSRYDTGVGNFVEINDARNSLLNFQNQQAQARYDLAVNRATLMRELGRPLSELVR